MIFVRNWYNKGSACTFKQPPFYVLAVINSFASVWSHLFRLAFRYACRSVRVPVFAALRANASIVAASMLMSSSCSFFLTRQNGQFSLYSGSFISFTPVALLILNELVCYYHFRELDEDKWFHILLENNDGKN